MDLKVYTKEEVSQPSGKNYVVTPNIIDLIPEVSIQNNIEIVTNALMLEDNEELEQSCCLATIWQRGLDPLNLNDGVRWSEALLEEINVVQLMEDITEAATSVTPSVNVSFDTIKGNNGESYLKYTLNAVV